MAPQLDGRLLLPSGLGPISLVEVKELKRRGILGGTVKLLLPTQVASQKGARTTVDRNAPELQREPKDSPAAAAIRILGLDGRTAAVADIQAQAAEATEDRPRVVYISDGGQQQHAWHHPDLFRQIVES